jgi:hypothetical protein
MARQRRTPPSRESSEQPRLTVERHVLLNELDAQITKGDTILVATREIYSMQTYEAVRADHYTWTEYNHTLLKQRFTTPAIADEYLGIFVGGGGGDLQERVKELANDVERDLRRLRSVRERLPLYENPRHPATSRVRDRRQAEARSSLCMVATMHESSRCMGSFAM